MFPGMLILEVQNWGEESGPIAGWSALVQYDDGELGDQSAPAIATNDTYQLVESGSSRHPRKDACEDREHDFDREELRSDPYLAKCANCGLSCETFGSWLKHDIPSICDVCGSLIYDSVFVDDYVCCIDCE